MAASFRRRQAQFLHGPYRIPNLDVEVAIYHDNKTPVGTYRAPGRFEANFFHGLAIRGQAHRPFCRTVLISAVTRRRPASRWPVAQKVFDLWVLGSDRLAWGLYALLGGNRLRRTGRSPASSGLAGLLQMLELPVSLCRTGLLNDLDQFSPAGPLPARAGSLARP